MDAYILREYRYKSQRLNENDLESIRSIVPNVRQTDAVKLVKACHTIVQRNRSVHGTLFESLVAECLKRCGIPFLTQVCIIDGKIAKKQKGYHAYDFVIYADYGDRARHKIFISCKTSIRERYLQDQKVSCRRLIMVTLEAPRPSHVRVARAGIDLVCIGGGALDRVLQDIRRHVK